MGLKDIIVAGLAVYQPYLLITGCYMWNKVLECGLHCIGRYNLVLVHSVVGISGTKAYNYTFRSLSSVR